MRDDTKNAIVIGVVESLDDPDNLGRVRVKYPIWEDQKSEWARMATLMAGKEQGTRFVPEENDEVLVAFCQGNHDDPYIIGSLWNSKAPPPPDDGDKLKNNWRYIKSRSGHIVRFDDTEGSEKLEFIGKDEKHRFVIDVAGEKIELMCESGNIVIEAPDGDVTVKAKNINLEASENMSLKAKEVTIKGDKINLN